MAFILIFNLTHPGKENQGSKLQCLLKVKEDLRYVLIFYDAKNNVLSLLNQNIEKKICRSQ